MNDSGFLPVPDMSAPAAALPAPAAAPFEDATLEEAYKFDREMLLSPAPATGKGLLLIGTLALFVLTQMRGSNTAFDIAALVGVLLVHELGHFAGMKLFGYRDVKMFFIPLLGAAVSGKRRGVAGWKEAVVLLLGPLPGLLAGTFLTFYLRVHPSPHLRSVAVSLVWINAFNLLPIAPLDGGQFFRVLIFSRHRYLELAFGLLAGLLCLAGAALGDFVLPIVGLTMLLGLPRQARLLRAAKELARKHPDLPADPAALGDQQGRDLFLAARNVTLRAARRHPRDGAVAMEQVLERAVSRGPSILASLALLLPWIVGLVATLVSTAGLAMTSEPSWEVQAVPQGGFSIRVPHREPVTKIRRASPLGETEMFSIHSTGTAGMFYVRWYDLPAGTVGNDEKLRAFLDRSRDVILSRAEGRLVEEGPLPDGSPGRAFLMSTKSYGVGRVRIAVVGARVFILWAPAEPAEEATKFLDSFVLTSPGGGTPAPQAR